MPALARQLAGDDRRARAVAVLEDLEQVVALPVGERAEAPVVEDEDVDAGEAREQRRVAAVRVRERELVKEARARGDRARGAPGDRPAARARRRGTSCRRRWRR